VRFELAGMLAGVLAGVLAFVLAFVLADLPADLRGHPPADLPKMHVLSIASRTPARCCSHIGACRPSRTVPQATRAMLKTHSGLRAQDVPASATQP